VKFLYKPLFLVVLLSLAACGRDNTTSAPAEPETSAAVEVVPPRPDIYANYALQADLSGFSEDQRKMLVLLIRASEIMDDLFWRQAYGDGYEAWLESIGVAATRRFAELNYGPWDRLNDDAPFIEGVGHKPHGAGFYPEDMTKEEFLQFMKDGLAKANAAKN